MPRRSTLHATTLTADDLDEAFSISSAVITTDRYGNQMLLIFAPDPSTANMLRVSMFNPDGPAGHEEASSREVLMRGVATFHFVLAEPVGDDEVIAWTSTPEFLDGSARVLYTQAWNELGYLASKIDDESERKRIYAAKHHGDEMVARATTTEGITAATHYLWRVRAGLPQMNPAMYRANPTPWVTKLLGNAYEQLEALVPAKWLPKLTKTSGKRTTFTGKLEEFGCGAYGCVLPTLDKGVVLKVTSDESEADFAKRLAPKLPTPIVTHYFQIADLHGAKRKGDNVYLLWREEADDVGKIDTVVGAHAEAAIAAQHDAAKAAFVAILEHEDPSTIGNRMEEWRDACRHMGDVPELAFVADGLLAAEAMGVFISDTHGGNLGVCMRNGSPTWVITDPGNVVVMRAELAS